MNQANQTDRILELIHTRKVSIGVIGLGYVGLPLAREFLKAGFLVLEKAQLVIDTRNALKLNGLVNGNVVKA